MSMTWGMTSKATAKETGVLVWAQQGPQQYQEQNFNYEVTARDGVYKGELYWPQDVSTMIGVHDVHGF